MKLSPVLRTIAGASLGFMMGAVVWRIITGPMREGEAPAEPFFRFNAARQSEGSFGEPRPPSLPIIARVPDFTLTERSGRAFTSRDLEGHVWIADFIFTSCAGTCPVMTGQMKRLHDQLLKSQEVRFVSFTVDPQNDTPEILRGYARGFVNPSRDSDGAGRWYFVTGDKKKLHTLAQKGFKLAVIEEPNADGPFTHSEKFALIDRQRRIRGYYDGTDPEKVEQLKADAERLIRAATVMERGPVKE